MAEIKSTQTTFTLPPHQRGGRRSKQQQRQRLTNDDLNKLFPEVVS